MEAYLIYTGNMGQVFGTEDVVHIRPEVIVGNSDLGPLTVLDRHIDRMFDGAGGGPTIIERILERLEPNYARRLVILTSRAVMEISALRVSLHGSFETTINLDK